MLHTEKVSKNGKEFHYMKENFQKVKKAEEEDLLNMENLNMKVNFWKTSFITMAPSALTIEISMLEHG
jgi:hypothetical protein